MAVLPGVTRPGGGSRLLGGAGPARAAGHTGPRNAHDALPRAAGYRVGQEITLRVRSWEEPEVQERYGTHNRKELDDPELLALPAFWAEPRD